MSGVPTHGVSGWLRDLPPDPVHPPLAGPTEARVVVVGAGVAGLALAYHLTRLVPPDELLVLEAGRTGDGASGRSTGIVGPGVGGPATALVKRYGADVARAMFGASLSGVAAMRRLVKSLPDDCELTNTYQLVAANAAGHTARLTAQAKTLRDLGFDVSYLDRDRTALRLGTDRYHGALLYPDIATVNPWRLCQVLKSALRSAGVRVAEGTQVSTVDGGDPVTLTAAGHRVRARTVVLATDGFTRTTGLYKRAIAAVRTHVVSTAPLPESLLARTGWDGDGALIDSRSFFNYFRLTADRRLFFGGGPAIPEERSSTGKVAAIQARILRELVDVFPALADVEVTDFWSGVTGSTFDRIPIVGPVPDQPGVWFAGAWCGHGLAMSALTAEMLAPCVAGEAQWPVALDQQGCVVRGPALGPDQQGDVLLPWLRGTAGWIPSGPVGGVALGAYLSSLDLTDRLSR
jgi:gamma-glutamylputrescine oxidase